MNFEWNFRKPDPLGYFQPYWDDMDPRTKYMLRTFASNTIVLGSILQTYDNMKFMDDYVENRGLSYDDILYPSHTQGAQSLASTVNFVSRNIYGLYKEDKYRAERRRAAESRNRRRSRTYY